MLAAPAHVPTAGEFGAPQEAAVSDGDLEVVGGGQDNTEAASFKIYPMELFTQIKFDCELMPLSVDESTLQHIEQMNVARRNTRSHTEEVFNKVKLDMEADPIFKLTEETVKLLVSKQFHISCQKTIPKQAKSAAPTDPSYFPSEESIMQALAEIEAEDEAEPEWCNDEAIVLEQDEEDFSAELKSFDIATMINSLDLNKSSLKNRHPSSKCPAGQHAIDIKSLMPESCNQDRKQIRPANRSFVRYSQVAGAKTGKDSYTRRKNGFSYANSAAELKPNQKFQGSQSGKDEKALDELFSSIAQPNGKDRPKSINPEGISPTVMKLFAKSPPPAKSEPLKQTRIQTTAEIFSKTQSEKKNSQGFIMDDSAILSNERSYSKWSAIMGPTQQNGRSKNVPNLINSIPLRMTTQRRRNYSNNQQRHISPKMQDKAQNYGCNEW